MRKVLLGKTICYVRPVELCDISKICEVYCEEEDIKITSDYILKASQSYKRMLLKGDYISGIYEGDELLGVVAVHFMEDCYPAYTDKPYAHLESIVVKKARRGEGVCTMHLKAILDELSTKTTYCIAQTASNNTAMKTAYTNAGMSRNGLNFWSSATKVK